VTDLLLIEGPPGTGKTTTLARRCKATVADRGPRSVAIASLTRTAAAEIAGRDTGVPEDLVGTLHAHAYRALDRPELAETPEKLREWGAMHPAHELTAGRRAQLEDATDQGTGQAPGDQLHAAVMNRRARLTPREHWTPEERAYDALWADFKKQTHALDFTDLIERAATDTPRHPAAPEILLLDEAQDFSALELRLAMTWASHCDKAVIVGDRRQALYGWRGADPRALDPERLRAAYQLLDQSHRVPGAVHALAQQWAAGLTIGAAPYKPTGEPGAARQLEASLTEPAAILDHVEADLAQGADTMILATCSYMLGPLLAELRRRAIPFHNPHRETQGQWNPLRGARRLLAYLRPDERAWGQQARLWTWADLKAWTDPLNARAALARGAKQLITEKCRPDRFGESHADEVVPPELICTLLDVADTTAHPAFRGDIDWWHDNLLASKRPAAAYPVQVARRRGPRALVETPRVVVGTVHSVKGAEAGRVYLAPDLSKQGYWHGWTQGGEPREAIIRMGYVGITRAREQITVLRPSTCEHMPLTVESSLSHAA
jgi:DNA helicase II / ATP-dependent DNA helicase PcrA